MTRREIGKNIYLTYVPSEKFKTSFLSAQMAVPLRRETAGRSALLVNVLSRGTERCPDMTALGRELDMLYGAHLEPTVRKKGENQLLGFDASCIDERCLPPGERLLEPLAELMGEMLCRPALREGRFAGDYVSSERENLAELIRSDLNDKRTYALRRLIEEMCAGEPYGVGRLGSAEEVEAITDLEDYYRDLLPRVRLELYYCGAASEERVAEAFRRSFARMPRGELLAPGTTLRRPAPDRPRVVVEELEVTQGKLCMGFRAEGDDVPANMVMNAMLGGETSSKLFLKVREEMSLCYYAESVYHRRKGLLTVDAGVAFEDAALAAEAVLDQLAAMAQGEWESWELESARRCLLCGFRSMEDSASAMEDFFMGQIFAGDSQSLEELAAEVAAVTPERVRAAAEAVRLDTVYYLKGKEARPCV